MTLSQIHALVQSHNRQHINSNHLCSMRPVSSSASAFVWRLISSLYKFFFFFTHVNLKVIALSFGNLGKHPGLQIYGNQRRGGVTQPILLWLLSPS